MPSTDELDYYRREIEEMQAHGWDFDACQAMLDEIDAELALRQVAS